jgi:hypothetical protein
VGQKVLDHVPRVNVGTRYRHVELTSQGSKKQGAAVNTMRGQEGWENDVETQGWWRRSRLKGQ